jgi:hypothetical protein
MYLNNDDLKLVTVIPARPFRLKAATFTSTVKNIILSVGSISYCLQEKALVSENLANGKTVKLDVTNYNTDNGPSAVPEGATEFITTHVDQLITVTDLNGNKRVINKNTVIAPPVKRINLEAERIAKEKAEKEAAEKAAAQKAKEEAERKAKAEEEARRKYDEEKRQEALKKVMERENKKNKEEAKKKVESFTVTPVSEEKKEETKETAVVTASVEVKKEEKKDNNNQQNNNGKFDKNNKNNHK